MRCPWLGRRYLGRTRVANSTIRNVYGLEDCFIWGNGDLYLHASLQWPQTDPLRQLVLIAWCSLLSVCTLCTISIQRLDAFRAEQKNAPNISEQNLPGWNQAVCNIQCEAIILFKIHKLRPLTPPNSYTNFNLPNLPNLSPASLTIHRILVRSLSSPSPLVFATATLPIHSHLPSPKL